MASLLDVAGLAAAYRRLVLWFGVQVIASLVMRAGEGSSLGALAGLVTFTSIVALAVYAYRVAIALGFVKADGWLWAIAMVLPLINVITLLVLSSKARRACRAHGVPMGLCGPSP